MPRIAPIELAAADTGVQATLGAVKAKIGMVPNLLSTFAHAPAALNGYLALSDALGSGTLTARQREIIALVTAQSNGCQYCLSAHTLGGKGAGLSPAGIVLARRGQAEDALDNAVAALAKTIVEARGHLTDAQLAEARLAGLDDARITEIVGNVALNVMTNFMNNVAHTDIDFPKVELALAA